MVTHGVVSMFEEFPTVAAVQSADAMVLAAALAPLTPEGIAALTEREAEVVVAATQRVSNAMAARQAAAVDTVLARTTDRLERDAGAFTVAGRSVPALEPDRATGSSLAPILRIAPRTMTARVHRAATLVNLLPRTLAQAWAGDLEPHRVGGIVQAATSVDWDRLTEFEARVFDSDISELTGKQLGERAARAALLSDPKSTERAKRAGRRSRCVGVRPGDFPGMTRWEAHLPAEDSQQMWAAVDELASEFLTADLEAGTPHARTVDNARADALVSLVRAQSRVTTVVELVLPATVVDPSGAPGIPADGSCVEADDDPVLRMSRGEIFDFSVGASTFEWALAEQLRVPLEIATNPHLTAGPDGHPAFVAGPISDPRIGVLLPDAIQALLSNPDVKVRVRSSDRDPPTKGRETYRPGRKLATRVRQRDVTCRFPGCGVVASQCDIDHVIPWPVGETSEANLHCLCRFHHAFKHRAGWSVTVAPDGTCTWTAPGGRIHTTRPPDLHDAAA